MFQTHKMNIKNKKNENLKEEEITTFMEISLDKISKVIKWQQSKSRSGTHNTKDVSEISYSTRKLRAQKGGGCARARNKGAVQFRGGATIFGPDGRKYDYKINKKEKLLGLKHAFSLKVKNKEIIIIDKLEFNNISVKEFLHFKKQMNLNTNSILFVDNCKNENLLKSINNIKEANFLPVVGINVLSIIENKFLICTEEAFKILKMRGVL
jgi:large subunit ribosomal protein L4